MAEAAVARHSPAKTSIDDFNLIVVYVSQFAANRQPNN
jgi:hypothetical protein